MVVQKFRIRLNLLGECDELGTILTRAIFRREQKHFHIWNNHFVIVQRHVSVVKSFILKKVLFCWY